VCGNGEAELALALAALRRHPADSGVQRGAARLLATLVVTDDANAAHAARAGAGPLVLAALRSLQASSAPAARDVLTLGVWALRQMCARAVRLRRATAPSPRCCSCCARTSRCASCKSLA
jgi:hypothetical protein